MGGLELLTDERGFLQCRGRGRRGLAGAVVGGGYGSCYPSFLPLLPVFFLQGSEGAVVVHPLGVHWSNPGAVR